MQNNYIFEAVKSSHLKEITKDLTETTMDQFFRDGFIKDIPIIGSIINIYNLSQNISNMFLTKKILKFLFELKNIPESKRKNFIQEIDSDKKSQNIGEKIIIILNKIDDADKATILGKLFKSTIEDQIEVSTFTRISYMIDKVYLEDLIELKYKTIDKLSLDIKYNLSQVVILHQSIKDNREHEDYVYRNTGNREYRAPRFEYSISDYGDNILKYGFD